LDIYIVGSTAVIWFRTSDGRTLRLTDRYSPFFHVEPAQNISEEDLLYRLSDCREVKSAKVEEKLTSLEGAGRKRLIKVETWGVGSFSVLARSLDQSPLVSKVYNADLRHVQRYLFTRLRVEPSSKVRFSFDGDRLLGVERLDDWHELAPPPFRLMLFTLDPALPGEGDDKAIKSIHASFMGKNTVFGGAGPETLAAFRDCIAEEDPDLLFCPRGDPFAYPLLRTSFEANRIPFDLGRCGDADQICRQGSFAGRVFLGDIFYGFSVDELSGLVERTRFSFAPMGLSTRWLSNKSIDSRSCFELMQRGYAIPREEYFESIRALGELVSRDRGGITITPDAGRLHENVAALDFDSQYPSLIVKNNLSYECMPACRGDPVKGGLQEGILPAVVKPWLERRLWLKKTKRYLPQGTALRASCEERIDALKMVLVTLYGVSGCCRNRFGNVVTFEEINKRSRECMLRAMAAAEGTGFHAIYGDVDSIFLSRSRAEREDYETLAGEIARETGLSMSLDRHFRFIAFLPLKGDPASSALKRYFGLTHDGKVEARGIELRRSDTPEFVRNFQIELIRQIMNSKDLDEAYSEGVARGMALLRRAIGQIRRGDVDQQDLVVRKRLGKSMDEYKAGVNQKFAALQMLHSGKDVEVGDDIPFIYTAHAHGNPACRIRAPELFSGSYDRDMYARLIEDAASTVWRGMGINPGLKPSLPTLERWLDL
jgi:DNA polymerase elongation subunit (family B)